MNEKIFFLKSTFLLSGICGKSIVLLLVIFTAASQPLSAGPPDLLLKGKPQAVREAYQFLSDTMKRDSFGWTPLMIAAASNPYPETIQVLTEAGENVAAESLDGWTPLMFAAAFNPKPEIIRALLNAGADPESRTRDGWTPLLGASRFMGEKLRLTGLETAALNPFPEESGWTPLFFAARFNPEPGVTEELLKAGSDPLTADEFGCTPGDYAERFNPESSVAELLKHRGKKEKPTTSLD